MMGMPTAHAVLIMSMPTICTQHTAFRHNTYPIMGKPMIQYARQKQGHGMQTMFSRATRHPCQRERQLTQATG